MILSDALLKMIRLKSSEKGQIPQLKKRKGSKASKLGTCSLPQEEEARETKASMKSTKPERFRRVFTEIHSDVIHRL